MNTISKMTGAAAIAAAGAAFIAPSIRPCPRVR
jgi:hypothetical protein